MVMGTVRICLENELDSAVWRIRPAERHLYANRLRGLLSILLDLCDSIQRRRNAAEGGLIC